MYANTMAKRDSSLKTTRSHSEALYDSLAQHKNSLLTKCLQFWPLGHSTHVGRFVTSLSVVRVGLPDPPCRHVTFYSFCHQQHALVLSTRPLWFTIHGKTHPTSQSSTMRPLSNSSNCSNCFQTSPWGILHLQRMLPRVRMESTPNRTA